MPASTAHCRTPRRAAVGAPLFLLALLVTLTLPGSAVAGPREAGAGREVPLRIATYNIYHGEGTDGRFDLDRTAREIRATGADVVALQEVDVHWGERSNWRDTARGLAERLDMRVFFAPIYTLDPPAQGKPQREYGLAVLSRYPIVDAENHEITRLSPLLPTFEPTLAPGFPEVVLNVRGARVHVYNTHLDYRGDPAVRRMQVDDMLAIMREDAGDQRVLLGDFNAPHEAPELDPLWEHVDDAWLAQRASHGDGLTYPASDPVKRIDYVTVSPQIEVQSARVPASSAADHLPVVADLIVTRGM